MQAITPIHPDLSTRNPLASDLDLHSATAVDALSRRVTREQLDGFQRLASELCATVRSLDQQRLQIVRDENLTTIGKRGALMRATQTAHQKIREMRASSTGYASHLAQIEEALSRDSAASTRSTEDRVVDQMRQREARDLLRGMDPIQVDAIYREAAQRGDDLLCRAIEGDPLQRLVLRESIDANRRTRLLSRDPERAQLHGQLSELAQAWEGLLTEAERLIGGAVDHTLEDIAGGAG